MIQLCSKVSKQDFQDFKDICCVANYFSHGQGNEMWSLKLCRRMWNFIKKKRLEFVLIGCCSCEWN